MGRQLGLALFATAAAALLTLTLRSGLSPAALVAKLEAIVDASGAAGPAVYAGAYAVGTTLFFPAALLTLGAGYLWGPTTGMAVVSAGSTLGAALAFLVSRYAARPLVAERLGRSARFRAVDAGVGRSGAQVVLLLRLSPLVPYTLLSYTLGLTSVRFPAYVAASWAGTLPAALAYVSAGAAGRATLEGGVTLGPMRIALTVAGVGATLWASKVLAGIAADALKAADAELAAGGPDAGGVGGSP
ncbi:hypothetical protein WJX81_006627 [Elliptochloris bilobata]|uniref:VTT domain-containing protein n=1 Tax=Elliptochloris bilobata TaxID=381761 RepID=A0AAW1QJ24_9CHLO